MPHLNRPDFCSLFVSFDNHYLDKLLMAYPTWLYHHPELLNMPQVWVYDPEQIKMNDPRLSKLEETFREFKAFHRAPYPYRAKFVPYEPAFTPDSQREKMLTALVHSADRVDTPWYLKLDADTFANESKGFYYDRWFNQNPAFIGNPWGYSKPNTVVDQMDEWAETVPMFMGTDPLAPTATKFDNKVKHPRMASWVMFGSTSFTQFCSDLVFQGKLPVPSQDTYLSYIATRQGSVWLTDKFRKYGWEHCRNVKGLRAACDKSLEPYYAEAS